MSSPNKDRLRTRRARVLQPIDRNSLSLTQYSVNHTEPKDATNILIHNQEEDKHLDEAKAEYAVNQRQKRSQNRAKYDEEQERNRRALRDVKIEESTPQWMGNTATGLNVLNQLASSFVPLYGAVQAPLYAAIGDTDTAKERIQQTLIPTALATGNPYVIAGINGYMMGEAANDIANNGLNFGNGLTLGLSALGTPQMLQTVRQLGTGVGKVNQFLTSPLTGKWTTFGNRQYRLNPSTLGMNGVPIESQQYPWQTMRLPIINNSRNVGVSRRPVDNINLKIQELNSRLQKTTNENELNNILLEYKNLVSPFNFDAQGLPTGSLGHLNIIGPTEDQLLQFQQLKGADKAIAIQQLLNGKSIPENNKFYALQEYLQSPEGKQGILSKELPNELKTNENITFLQDYLDALPAGKASVHPDFPTGSTNKELREAAKKYAQTNGAREVIHKNGNIEDEGYFSTDSLPLLLSRLIGRAKQGKVYVRNNEGEVPLNRFGQVNYVQDGYMNPVFYKPEGNLIYNDATIPYEFYGDRVTGMFGNKVITQNMIDEYNNASKEAQQVLSRTYGRGLTQEDLNQPIYSLWKTPQQVVDDINTKYEQLNNILLQQGKEGLSPFEDGKFIKFDTDKMRFMTKNHSLYSLKNGGKLSTAF